MKEKFLEISNVSKTFPGVKALNNVQFDIYPGEVHALVGENGAGKSTLIKILAGVQPPDDGARIVIEGKETVLENPMDAIKKGISVIYQDFSLFTNLTVAENIGINEIIEKKQQFLNWKEINAKAKEALSFMKADISPKEIVGNLSVAKQQMVAIASAVAQNAKMIIMDEPTSALSRREVERLYEIIDDLKARGIAIMFVGHKMDELFHVADRFTVFRDGKYVDTVNAKEVTEQDLIAMMVGRKIEYKKYAVLDHEGPVVLKVEGLSKKGNFKDISFEVQAGEVLGVTGLVGAGRTELMEVIYGAQPLESGQIYYKGQPVKIDSPRKGIKTGIGLVPEDRKGKGLFLDKNVAWNSTINCLDRFANGTFGLVRTKEVEKEAEKYQKAFNIKTPSLNQLVMNLSGGNQQKVVLAKTMAADAEVIIFDEPTRGIDVGAKQEIYNLMNELAAQGKGILMVSSDMPELLGMCDRIVVISEGRQTGIVDKEDFSQETILSLASISAVKDA